MFRKTAGSPPFLQNVDEDADEDENKEVVLLSLDKISEELFAARTAVGLGGAARLFCKTWAKLRPQNFLPGFKKIGQMLWLSVTK